MQECLPWQKKIFPNYEILLTSKLTLKKKRKKKEKKTHMRRHQCCQSSAAICDLSIVVSFGHNELWRPKGSNEGLSNLSNVVAIGHNETVAAEDRKSGY